MAPLDVLIAFNQPVLPSDHPDRASESGVLEALTAVEQALRSSGHRPRRLAIRPPLASVLGDLQRTAAPDVVFNLCEGLQGVGEGESQVAGLFELLGWPLTGSSSQCLALVRDKPRTKWLLQGAGLASPAFSLHSAEQRATSEELRGLLNTGPLIVKPAREDASLGIGPESVVSDLPTLMAQIRRVESRYGAVLVEQFIAGREFNAGIIAIPEPQLLPLAEIEFPSEIPAEQRIVTYNAKWVSGGPDDRSTPACCPACVDDKLAAHLSKIALSAYRLAGCRDYARVDLRVDSRGNVFVLEINANPDISPSGGLARAVRASGIGYDEFILRLVETAWQGRGEHRLIQPAERSRAERPQKGADVQGSLSLRELRDEDVPALVQILADSQMFREDEVAVGEEVLREAVTDGPAGDYKVVVADAEGRPVGWACYGHVPMTDATYDLYWIAVDPTRQHGGVGRRLLQSVEQLLAARGGRWLLAETSATPVYASTQKFYERCGYKILSNIDDFYRPGDGRIVFGKRLDR